MTPAVRVHELTKIFRVWRRPADMLIETISGRRRHTEFTALKDVSFEVKRGSVVGVLGRNGAGKSTLLRIIAGTLDKTSGEVAVDGRVAAILELGTGFHPEYTGRENVYLGGLCLGLTRREVAAKMDEIIEFSELEEFIDQPFKTFSSGMQARLTFAVATSVDPDVLIIDEALSVGDARFALKSFDRIRNFARANKSILFVSHDINQVTTFCDEAIMLERGEVLAKGEPKRVGNMYHELLFGGQAKRVAKRAVSAVIRESEPAVTPLNGAAATRGESAATAISVRIETMNVCDPDGNSVSELDSLSKYIFTAEFAAISDVGDVAAGVLIRTYRGVDVAVINYPQGATTPFISLAAGDRARATLAFRNNLAPGHFFATFRLYNRQGDILDTQPDAIEFVVSPSRGIYAASLGNLDACFSVKVAV